MKVGVVMGTTFGIIAIWFILVLILVVLFAIDQFL